MENNKYQQAIETLKERKAELEQEISSLETSIRSMERLSVSSPSYYKAEVVKPVKQQKPNDYDENWSLAKKFLYLLSKHKRFLHFREAADLINSLENNQYDVKDLTRKLSSGTQSLKSKDKIVKVKVDSNNKNSFWGAPAWLDENGNIKEEFKYNEDYVYVPGETEEDLFSF